MSELLELLVDVGLRDFSTPTRVMLDFPGLSRAIDSAGHCADVTPHNIGEVWGNARSV